MWSPTNGTTTLKKDIHRGCSVNSLPLHGTVHTGHYSPFKKIIIMIDMKKWKCGIGSEKILFCNDFFIWIVTKE